MAVKVLVIEPIRKTVSSAIGIRVSMSARPCAEKNSRDPSRTTPKARPTAGQRLRISPTRAFMSDWPTCVIVPPPRVAETVHFTREPAPSLAPTLLRPDRDGRGRATPIGKADVPGSSAATGGRVHSGLLERAATRRFDLRGRADGRPAEGGRRSPVGAHQQPALRLAP